MCHGCFSIIKRGAELLSGEFDFPKYPVTSSAGELKASTPSDPSRAACLRAVIPAQAGIQGSELRVHPPAHAIIAL